MKKILEMNRSNITAISAAAEAALQKVAAQYGLILKQERGTFSPADGTFTTKWTFVCETENGIPADFIRSAAFFNLKPEDYGREFRASRGLYTLCGIKPKNRKYPILGKCVSTGKTYKFTEDVLARQWGA